MNRPFRLFNAFATAIAAATGLVTLVAYFVSAPLLRAAQAGLLLMVSVVAAWAVLAGALNLMIVHSRKFMSQAPGWAYSLFAILGFLAVIVVNLLAPLLNWGHGAGSAANTWLLTYLISAGGAALAGMVAFFLVYAAYRLLRRRPTTTTVVFIVTTVLALLALAPWPAGAVNPLIFGLSVRDWLGAVTRVPAIAGARGLLLGIALGAVATGLRVLLGLDRPYRD